MTYEDFLPQEEPGRPLVQVPPGSIDLLMRRIADYRRQQRRRRLAARLLVTVAVMAAVYLFAMRRINDVPKVETVEKHAQPVAPVVTRSVAREAVNRDTLAPRAVAVRRKDDVVAAATPSGNVKITIDGKELRDEAELTGILRKLDGCTPRTVVMVRDGKSTTYIVHPPHELDSRCTSAPAPHE